MKMKLISYMLFVGFAVSAGYASYHGGAERVIVSLLFAILNVVAFVINAGFASQVEEAYDTSQKAAKKSELAIDVVKSYGNRNDAAVRKLEAEIEELKAKVSRFSISQLR